MKTLVFIDNDRLDKTKEDSDDIKNRLEDNGLAAKYVDSMELISDLHFMKDNKIMKLLFDPKTAICTYSMYTTTHYGSLFQLTHFLSKAAELKITNKVYICGSGEILETLNRYITDEEQNPLKILNTIETNFIITYVKKDMKFYRLRLELKGYFEDSFKLEEIDLKKILK